ncbi:MAG TPA: OPT/YSL family transporter, partial [Phycisphaerales bacterium]|nr:OPT/YSL family transporter [Phycisphaerales bacterium]
MAIPQLTPEQVRTWSREEKDRWWLANVFRGDMPQLTLRSAVTGFFLGGILSATNLYVGARTGWTLGVGLTSVILAFAAFRVMSRIGFKDMTILENNAMQSIATSAGYMTSPLIAGFTAYMWVTNTLVPAWHMFWFMVVMSVLGVLVAFPLKRRFINDEQQPFPEGRACGVLLDALYSSSAAAAGMFKAKMLAFFALGSAFVTFLTHENYWKFLNALRLYRSSGAPWSEVRRNWGPFLEANKEEIDKAWHLYHNFDHLYAWLASKGMEPRLSNVTLKELGLNPALELSMFGAGALMGIKAATSLLLGMLINFTVLVPWMIAIGEIEPRSGSVADGTAVFGRSHIVNSWSLWWGIVMMVVASMVALFAKPKVLLDAARSLFAFAKKDSREDPVRHIELPLWLSFLGVPIVGAVGVVLAHEFFAVPWLFGATAILMICFLTLIAASSTAMTGTTPTGSLSKIPQFTYGALDP